MAKTVVRRVLGAVFGLFLFLVFGGTLWFAAQPPFQFFHLLLFAGMGFIGLFGLNLAIQNVLGRSDQEGFFYAALKRLQRLGTPTLTLGVPLILLLDVLQALLFGSAAYRLQALGHLTIWLVWLLQVAVHEAGHVLAARGAGLLPTRIIVGPLEFSRRSGRWKPQICKEWISAFGGLVEAGPSTGPLSPQQTLLFAAGGPLASALFLIPVIYWNPYPLEQLLRLPGGPEGAFFAVGILYGLLFLVVSLIPSRLASGGLPSDGHQILGALRTLQRSSAE